MERLGFERASERERSFEIKKFQRPFALLLLGRFLNSLPFFSLSLSLSLCFLCFFFFFFKFYYLYLLFSFHCVNKKKVELAEGENPSLIRIMYLTPLDYLVANLSAFFFLTKLPFYYGITLLLIISFCLRNSPNYPSSFLSLSNFFFFSFMGNKLFQVNAT